MLKIFISLYFLVYQRIIDIFVVINNYNTTLNNNNYTTLINSYSTTLINNTTTNLI